MSVRSTTSVLSSPDGMMVIVLAPWTSTGYHPDGKPFPRPGRATLVFCRNAHGWLCAHCHMSLNRGVPQESHANRPMGRQVNSTLSVRRQRQGDRLGEDQELVKVIPDSCRLSWRSHTESRCPSGFPCHRALHQARSARQPRQRSCPLAANGDVRWDVRIGGDYPQLMWIVRCRALSRRPQSNHRNCGSGRRQ